MIDQTLPSSCPWVQQGGANGSKSGRTKRRSKIAKLEDWQSLCVEAGMRFVLAFLLVAHGILAEFLKRG